MRCIVCGDPTGVRCCEFGADVACGRCRDTGTVLVPGPCDVAPVEVACPSCVVGKARAA